MKVDLIVVRSTPVVEAAKGDHNDSAGDDGRWRSGAERFCRQPRATRREHYGNVQYDAEACGKKVGPFEEIRPKLSRVAFLAHSSDPLHLVFVKYAQQAAQA